MFLDSTCFGASEVLESMLTTASGGLLKSHDLLLEDLELVRGALFSQVSGVCGIVGLSSLKVRATVVLACASELLSVIYPQEGISPRESVAELSNQLAGRLQHLLWQQGIKDISLSTPTVIDAKYLSLATPSRGLLPPILRKVNGLPLAILIDGELDPSFDFSAAVKPDEPACVPEGGSIVF